ncbi:hypothetical protein J8M20_03140 [Pseudoalteromonas luteoviolacea]|uniref:hypothetical protein n=1 Tax=Pseudoalteromonas luteoviolacea TaxID=43657 RepID=UPI001B396C7E|nr:hypothetical protein [Pseudoalteromonas luteoviolacea]MBQ4810310.1 hypothetical protein [Pseudoalteromonas luteoviolacea]
MILNSIDGITRDLFDQDGSCRDFNFKAKKLEHIVALIAWFQERYNTLSCYGDLGEFSDFSSCNTRLTTLCPSQYVQIICQDTSTLIKHIQVFLYIEDNGNIDVEISFFAQDIDRSQFELGPFLALLKTWQILAQADIGYLRYEDASWHFGDKNDVIYISKLV